MIRQMQSNDYKTEVSRSSRVFTILLAICISNGIASGQVTTATSSSILASESGNTDEPELLLPKMQLESKDQVHNLIHVQSDSNGSKLFAITSRPYRLQVWNTVDGAHKGFDLPVRRDYNDIKRAKLSSDEKSVLLLEVFGRDSESTAVLHVVSLETGSLISKNTIPLAGRNRPASLDLNCEKCDFYENEKLLFVKYRIHGNVRDSWLEVYSLANGEVLYGFSPHENNRELAGTDYALFDFAYNPDTKSLVTIGTSKASLNTVRIWDLTDREPKMTAEAVVEIKDRKAISALNRVFWGDGNSVVTFENAFGSGARRTLFRKWTSGGNGRLSQSIEWPCEKSIEHYTELSISSDKKHICVSNSSYGKFASLYNVNSGEEAVYSDPSSLFKDFEEHGCFAPDKCAYIYLNGQGEFKAFQFQDVSLGRRMLR